MSLDFGELDVFANNTEDLPFTALLYAADGVTGAALAAGDVVYCVLSSRTKGEPGAAVLTLNSNAATANKSKVFVTTSGTASPHAAAAGYVRFAQADLAAIVATWAAAIGSQRYVCELYYLDDSETDPVDARKLFLRGTIHLHRSAP